VIAVALMMVGNIVVAGPLMAGLFIAVRRRMLEGRTEIMDVFAGFSFFIDAFLIGLLTAAFLIMGAALLFFPVLLVAALYQFPFVFLVDRKQSFWDAMESSRKLSLSDLAGMLLFVILIALLNFAGLLLFGLGVLVTIPVSVAAILAGYNEMAGIVHRQRVNPGPIIIP
jgi:uncharacterized membrane protein